MSAVARTSPSKPMISQPSPLRRSEATAASRRAHPASQHFSTRCGSTTKPSPSQSPPEARVSPSRSAAPAASKRNMAPGSKRGLSAITSKRRWSRSAVSSCSVPLVMMAAGVSSA